MTLKEYWTSRGGSITALAKHLGFVGDHTRKTVYRYVEHERIPDLAVMRAIEKRTKGKVKVSDWPNKSDPRSKRDRLPDQSQKALGALPPLDRSSLSDGTAAL